MSGEQMTPVVPTPAVLRRSAPSARTDSVQFGFVDDDGNVFVELEGDRVSVGQWVAGSAQEGLAFFARKFDDLDTECTLIATRLADGHLNPELARESLERIEQALNPPQCVGDIARLRKHIDDLRGRIAELEVVRAQERAARKAEALERRHALVAQAESLADSTAWKTTAAAYADIVEEWKALPRADRATEQELWQRLSAARASFDKRRRSHFAEREVARKQALEAKRALIARAEQLSTSTDWAGTSKAFKDLMQQWKVAPRGTKSDEDKLWKRFKAAQDAFFAARSAADAARDADLEPNIAPKQALVEQAEALLPITDVAAAKKALREIQRRWDGLGDLPASQRKALESRLAKVEEALRKAEQHTWQRSNPEGLARAESTVSAFDAALAKLAVELERARASGDARKQADLTAKIAQTNALKEAAERAARDFR